MGNFLLIRGPYLDDMEPLFVFSDGTPVTPNQAFEGFDRKNGIEPCGLWNAFIKSGKNYRFKISVHSGRSGQMEVHNGLLIYP